MHVMSLSTIMQNDDAVSLLLEVMEATSICALAATARAWLTATKPAREQALTIRLQREGFDGCTSLTTLRVPAGVVSIGNRAFRGCSSLAAITLPDGLTSIGDRAFRGCSALAAITLPDGLTSIGGGAFGAARPFPRVASPTWPV